MFNGKLGVGVLLYTLTDNEGWEELLPIIFRKLSKSRLFASIKNFEQQSSTELTINSIEEQKNNR